MRRSLNSVNNIGSIYQRSSRPQASRGPTGWVLRQKFVPWAYRDDWSVSVPLQWPPPEAARFAVTIPRPMLCTSLSVPLACLRNRPGSWYSQFPVLGASFTHPILARGCKSSINPCINHVVSACGKNKGKVGSVGTDRPGRFRSEFFLRIVPGGRIWWNHAWERNCHGEHFER